MARALLCLQNRHQCIQLIEDVVYIACSWRFSFPIGGKFNAIRTIGERM